MFGKVSSMRVIKFLLPVLLFTGLSLASAQATEFGGRFMLKDHHGKIVKDSDFMGDFLLITFGYTYCPDVCPTGLQKISDTLDELGDAAKFVTPIFITIDPKRDTVPVMADYVKNFHPSFVGLTGTDAMISHVAKAYKVKYMRSPESKPDDEDYLMDHTANTYLMGHDGKFIARFHHRTRVPQMVEQVKAALGH